MTVTVGTDVFASVADADAYWTKRGNTVWVALDNAVKEPLLVKASDYLERTFTWRGTKKPGQRLGWPDRTDAYDDECSLLTGTPWQVAEASFIAADQIRKGVDVEGVITTGTVVTLEKIDVITIEYDTTSAIIGPAVLTQVYQLLGTVTTINQLLRS